MTDPLERLRTALAGRYRVERELGRGGAATVYLAEDLKHHRQVALKVLRPEVAATFDAERFQREIEIAAQLSHPHIVPLIDSGEAAGLRYYVTAYVPGGSLRERLERDGALPVADVVRITAEVGAALGFAHRRNVVHRDVKPENILFADEHAVLADFGVAESGSGAVTVTEEQLVNILNYLAAKAQNADRWVNGCGGTETPFVRHGVRYLWCYNHATGKSGYLNLDTDMIVDHDEIVRMLSS